jgi:hypothetical protein
MSLPSNRFMLTRNVVGNYADHTAAATGGVPSDGLIEPAALSRFMSHDFRRVACVAPKAATVGRAC